MATAEFSKCPTAWIIQRRGLRAFHVPEVGACISALKVYLAVVLRANFYPTNDYPRAGTAVLSYSQFAELLDLSRAMIARGVSKLEAEKLIEVDRSLNTNLYSLTDFENGDGWGKLPKRHLFSGPGFGIRKLTQFSMRHRAHLNALKLYLLFIAFRDSKANAAKIAYDTIGEYTGIPKNHIHPAISVLIDLSLIDVDRSPPNSEKVNQSNLYYIRGLTTRFRRVVEDVDPAVAKDFPTIVTTG